MLLACRDVLDLASVLNMHGCVMEEYLSPILGNLAQCLRSQDNRCRGMESSRERMLDTFIPDILCYLIKESWLTVRLLFSVLNCETAPLVCQHVQLLYSSRDGRDCISSWCREGQYATR